ncbi:unnamed protein product [Linum tenue]|uniref:Uncharacterized protein n=1 Tax=Linum tenue TaxID=586396 RepID=A0AAV0HLX6_9ROSI|nr:unnamed protein product [Linum tenue]
MSSTAVSQLFDLPAGEQICYVQCGFCTTILLVSVPCSSLSMVVTVRCGQCTSLLSVNMLKASFLPFHLLAASLTKQQQQEEEEEEEEEAAVHHLNRIINKPPEKRQRAPSAYNRFIKYLRRTDLSLSFSMIVRELGSEFVVTIYSFSCCCCGREEIKRLKADNPKMAHKEAFSMAAKNWAHFPPAHYDDNEVGFNKQQLQEGGRS